MDFFLNSLVISGLWKAISLEQMEKMKEDQRKQKIVLYACQLQLQSNRFPKHCFSNKNFYRLFKKYFNKKCRETNWDSLIKLLPLLENKDIDEECLSRIEESKKIQNYQTQDQIVQKALKKYLRD